MNRDEVMKLLIAMSVWLEPAIKGTKSNTYNINLEEPAEVEKLRQRILAVLDKQEDLKCKK